MFYPDDTTEWHLTFEVPCRRRNVTEADIVLSVWSHVPPPLNGDIVENNSHDPDWFKKDPPQSVNGYK